jgi:hypothetical protein
MSSPSLQFTSESKTKLDMPLSLIVGQDSIKAALILLAVNPTIGGIVIAGVTSTQTNSHSLTYAHIHPPLFIHTHPPLFTHSLIASQ